MNRDAFRGPHPELDLPQFFERNEPEPECIVGVVRIVRDAVHDIDDLRFDQRPTASAELGALRSIDPPAVFDERLAHLERQVQAGKVRIALFEFVHAAEAEEVVVEAAVFLEALVQRNLARVAERRVPDVVGEGNGFGQVFVQAQSASDGAGQLSDFERMSEPRSVVVVDGGDEHLGLAGHAAERGAVDDAFAIALVERAELVLALRVLPPAGHRRTHGIRGQPRLFVRMPVGVGDG